MLKDSKQTKEVKLKISIANKGRTAWNKGKKTGIVTKGSTGMKWTDEQRKNLIRKKGKESPFWKGSKAKYRSLHVWLSNTFGKPNICEACKNAGLVGRQIHWANKDHKYRRVISDWLRLCAKCHGEYDKNHLLRKHQKGENNFA
jgi:hypothetical protein